MLLLAPALLLGVAVEKFIHAAVNSVETAVHQPTRRAVHIEIGANDGKWSTTIAKKMCRDPTARPRPEADKHLFVVVEPQAQFRTYLTEKAMFWNSNSSACRFEFVPACAWTRDGNISFSLTRDSRGAHIGVDPPKRKNPHKPGSPLTTMPTIDFAAFMHRKVHPSDLVFMKVDVEVAEFTLLPHLLAHGALCSVDLMLIEWHFSRIHNHNARLGALGLRLSLADLLERGCPPRPPREASDPSSGRRFVQHDEAQLSRHHVVPGLYERARWHNGNPPIDNRTGVMPWSQPVKIYTQTQMAESLEAPTATSSLSSEGGTSPPASSEP